MTIQANIIMNEDTDNGGPVGNQNPYPMFAYKFEKIVLGGKKMFKRIKVFLAVALVVMMCLAGSLTAFADDPVINKDGAVIGTETSPVKVGITKNLLMPIGTNVPNATFSFKATPITVDGIAYNKDLVAPNMPALNSTNLTIKYQTSPSITYASETSGDVTTATIHTADILAGVNFPHAGIYVYTITENNTGTNPGIEADIKHQTLTYSPAIYTLTIYVENNAAGTGTYVAAVGDKITTADNPDQEEGTKVDPSQGASKMVFTNTYIKINGPADPEEPETPGTKPSTLLVSKTISATGLADTTKYFEYTMTVQAPTMVYDPEDEKSTASAPIYNAYVVNKNGSVVSATDLADAAKNNVSVTPKTDSYLNAYFEFVSGEENTFSLTDGQKLVFFSTPVGTSYGVTEAGYANYVADVKVTYAGDSVKVAYTENAGKEAYINQPLNTDPSIPSNNPYFGLSSGVPASLKNLVGDSVGDSTNAANSAKFTNTYFTISPTGLIINVLPFVGLIILAGGALVAFIVVRSRKRIADSE